MRGEAMGPALICATTHLPENAAAGGPRATERALAAAMGAELLHYGDLAAGPARRRVEAALRLDLSLAREARRRLNGHSVVYSTSEKVGLPLLALLGKRAAPHVMLAHHLLSPRKFHLVKASGLLGRLSRLICLTRAEREIAATQAGLAPERVVMVEGVGVDQHFFAPAPGHGEGYILAVGATARDYATLVRALGGYSARVIVAAASRWVAGPRVAGEIPENFTFLPKQPPAEMRALYAGCAVVVVPLHSSTQYSAGRTTFAEAMATGKAIVATDVPGVRDYVETGRNGLLAPAGDADALKGAVERIIRDEELARALGMAGRRLAEEKWNVDVFVDFLWRELGAAAREGAGASD